MSTPPVVQQPTPKPTSAVKLQIGAIPKELKKFNRWILWKYSQITRPDGTTKWTKTPHSPSGGHKIDATNFANGASFTEAVQALRSNKSKFDGLGFLLGEGIAGIDVDDCIDDDGNLTERGRRMSEAYRDTYAEISPSGRGFKILVDIGDDPKLAVIGKNTAEMEIYGGKRYFTVTGAALPGHAPKVAPMAQAFAQTAEALGANKGSAPAVADMPTDRAKEAVGIDLRAARELLDHLPFRWCDEYGDWLRAGMAIHHEFGGSAEALDLWNEWSQRSPKFDDGACADKWNTFGRPGKDVVSIRTLVREAQATGWRAPHTIEAAIREFTPFDEPEVTVDDEGVYSDAPTWWDKYSASTLLLTTPPRREWVWQGVLQAGKVMVLAGSGGTSKSFLMLGAAVQHSLGNEWGPFKLAEGYEPGRTLLMYGEEDKDDVHERVHVFREQFMLTDEQIATVGARLAVLPLRGENIELARQDHTLGVQITKQLDRLRERIEQYQIKLLVMDPMSMLHSLEENDNIAITKLMNALDALAMETKCAIVIIHHFGKGGVMTAREVNETNVRGASALVARARTVVVMHRLREDEAASWGVPEGEHARWVMWLVAKNNNGPTGQRTWFNVNPHNGAIVPAPTDLVYTNTRDFREAARAHSEETMQQEITEREAIRRQNEAEESIRENGRMMLLFRYAVDTDGKIPSLTRCIELVNAIPALRCAGNKVKTLLKKLKDEGYLDSDNTLRTSARNWIDEHEILE